MSQPLRLYRDRIVLVLGAVLLSAALWANDKPCPEAAPQPAKPQYSEAELAHQQWMRGWYRELEASDEPAFLLVAGWHRLIEDRNSPDAEMLFQRAAAQPNLDRASLLALIVHCLPNRGWGWCDVNTWKQQLLERDPRNANAYLLQLTQEIGADSTIHWDTESNRAWLARAAEADHVNGYYGQHATRLFESALEYIRRFPYPEPTAEDLARIPDVELRELLARDGSALWPIAAMGLALVTPWMDSTGPISNVYQLCKSQLPYGDAAVQRDCQKLAQLAVDTGNGWIDRSVLGAGLPGTRDEFMGRDDHAALRATMTWGLECSRVEWMSGFPDILHATEPVVRQFIEETETLGEFEATRRAAIRDFVAHPESYDHDPAECPEPKFPDIDWALND